MRIQRQAFTIVELITVLVCISFLVSISLPAILSMREESKEQMCADQLRKIVLQSHNFHNSTKRLPPATIGVEGVVFPEDWADEDHKDYWRNYQNTSALALVMPWSEMIEEYKKVEVIAFDIYTRLTHYPDPGRRAYSWQGEIPGLKEVASNRAPAYECPADDINEVGGLSIKIASQPLTFKNDDSEDDIGTQVWPDDSVDLKATNYVACGGVTGRMDRPERIRWKGCMTSRARVTLETILDGTANTVMFAETIGGIKASNRSSAYAWFSAGFARGRGDMPYLQAEDPDNPDLKILGDSTNSSLFGFGSKHRDGVMMGFAGGSIRMVNRDADWQVLYQIYGYRDGGTPNLDRISSPITVSTSKKNNTESTRKSERQSSSDSEFMQADTEEQVLLLRKEMQRLEEKIDRLSDLVEQLQKDKARSDSRRNSPLDVDRNE